MCNKDNCDNCIQDILKVILILQQSVCQNDCCLETCDKGYLGNNKSLSFNTRPITLYGCGSNESIKMPISKNPLVTDVSDVFRIEKLDGNCATFRVLVPNTEPTIPLMPYEATDSFFTMNLDCVCRLRCLEDTYVNCV